MRNVKKKAGYTLLEVLIVVALLALLTAIILPVIARARYAGYRAVCTSNLRQMGMAFQMYVEDAERRPPHIGALVSARYSDNRILLCPADITGNYGGLLNKDQDPPLISFPYSYRYFGHWPDHWWYPLMQDGAAGIFVCQLHGEQTELADSLSNSNHVGGLEFEGLILRQQVDGAVVRRHVLLERVVCPGGAVRCYSINPWRLLSDLPPPYPFNIPVPCCGS